MMVPRRTDSAVIWIARLLVMVIASAVYLTAHLVAKLDEGLSAVLALAWTSVVGPIG